MADVIVEREYETPMTKGDIFTMARASGSCIQRYNIEWHTSFLSGSGKRLTCHFHAGDAETVRTALRQLGVVTRAVWSGTLHDTGIEKTPNVMVERRFEEAVTLDSVQAMEDAFAYCLEMHNVTFVRTFFSRDRKRMLCLYHAPDAESVREAQRKAGMPVERVWACQVIDPHTDSSP